MSAHAGRIGPNVLIQSAAAMRDRLGGDAAVALVQRSTALHPDALPQDMVDERLANALLAELLRAQGATVARAVMRDAGRRTGEYLLAHRIPRAAQWLLPRLPARVALRLLLQAIGRHSWTFAGSAQLHITPGDPAIIALRHCPLCAGQQSHEPLCDFYAGTFGRLAQVLLGPDGWAEEVACEARGDSACRFLMGSRR